MNVYVNVMTGSGSGQHITHFGQHLPHIEWQPSDVDNGLFASIDCYTKSMSLTNVLPPITLDVSAPVDQWPIPKTIKLDLIFCANVIHITPWKCTQGLLRGSAQLLATGGLLVTYGPYACHGVLSPQSNVEFDTSLRSQNPKWGIRDVTDLKRLAQENRLNLVSSHEMPANNKVLVFKKY